MRQGFTLIELSIVLVIIGLIVGGVLTGQSLIIAAGVRAQITQIEKYNTAANSFYGKYGYLPGDIPAAPAAQFGFAARGQYAGQGDGNGLLEGVYQNYYSSNLGVIQLAGETVTFWVDLSTAHMIDGGFTTASPTTIPGSNITTSSNPAISAFFPAAKIGQGNYVYVWSGGSYSSGGLYNGINYFGLSVTSSIGAPLGKLKSVPGLTVFQASAIDKKIDDGYPQSGRITAQYVNTDPYWTDGTDAYYYPIYNGATAGSATTCYDNGYVNGATQQYSVAQNNGTGVNCALSFRMQAGD